MSPSGSIPDDTKTVTNTAAAMDIQGSDQLINGMSHSPVKRDHPPTAHQHIWYITGPAGCGKSTVAQYIASSLGLPFKEGDNFHPQANIEKMSQGHPLTDQDRWDWLVALRIAAEKTLDGLPTTAPSPNAGSSLSTTPEPEPASGSLRNGAFLELPAPKSRPQGVVLTCSALKRKYRDVLRTSAYYNPRVLVHFLYLDASEGILLERVKARKGHYMGAEMVHSQFESLEVPAADEWDVLSVDVGGTKEAVESEALAAVEDCVRNVVDRDEKK